MHAEGQLAVVAVFAGFLLKTLFGFCLCWAISKVVVCPRRKFLVWFAFPLIAGAYWLWLVVSFIPHAAPAFSVPIHISVRPEPVAMWKMPASWGYPLSIVERTLGILYVIGLGNFLVTRIKKQVRLRWVLRFAYSAPEPIQDLFRSISVQYGAEQAQLLVLSGIHSPATFGWTRPVVLLPPLCLEQDQNELADIFRHELQHVARHDFFFHNIASLCRSLLFFHPAVWYAMRRMELESELACDLAVVRDSPERRASYAECLVRFARLHASQEPTPWNLEFAGSAVQLKARVRSVLTEAGAVPAWLVGLRAGIGMLLLAAFLCIAPSLFVVLSYAHQIAPSLEPTMLSDRPVARIGKRSLLRVHRVRVNWTRSLSAPAESPAVVVPTTHSETSLQTTPRARLESNTLSSGDPVPTLQQRGAGGADTTSKPAQATVFFISNPTSVGSGSTGMKKRSIASAVMTGAGEAVRFAGTHGKEIH